MKKNMNAKIVGFLLCTLVLATCTSSIKEIAIAERITERDVDVPEIKNTEIITVSFCAGKITNLRYEYYYD